MRRSLVPALTVAVVLAGCSSNNDGAEPGPTATLPVVATTSAAPSPTPSPTVSATASPTPLACVCAIPAKPGDVDGDGTRDTVRATAELLTVVLSSGASVTAPVHAESPRSPAVLGYADVDRDGRSEVFVETAQGASTQFATPYRFDGKALRELDLDGDPARLGFGGSVTHGDGFRCRNGLLEVLSAESQDGATYTVRVDTYSLGRSELVLRSTANKQARQGDALFEASYRPDCGTVGD